MSIVSKISHFSNLELEPLHKENKRTVPHYIFDRAREYVVTKVLVLAKIAFQDHCYPSSLKNIKNSQISKETTTCRIIKNKSFIKLLFRCIKPSLLVCALRALRNYRCAFSSMGGCHAAM